MQKVKKAGRWSAYFTSEKGRKFTLRLAAGATIGLFAANFIPQTLLLEKYRETVQCYRMGVEREIPDKVKKRVEMAMEKLQLSKFEKSLIKPFVVYGFDNFHAGSTKYNSGAIIGVPANYSYGLPSDINPQDVRFRNQLINWNSESGKLLQEALVLKEDEQIFGICKSILQAQTHKILLDSIYPAATFLICYSSANGINQKFNFYARPMSLRLTLYAIIGLFGLGVWSFSKDFTQVYLDGETDKELCKLGPEFIEAGVRYYDKILKKNMALRTLLEDDTYTAKGNENYLVRQKSMPLTVRKSYFELRLEELRKQLDEKQDQAAAS
ncbi:unnamed protein product [Hermetia illucens]|uniref:Transmembrane protein 177 n=1 Tax=Hermetia illucens TaxID=343691 RepID=A0A7R8UCV2_HERIL|nr:transmembrane protein 177 [Hermetia illucens]CAD7078437.1 unnamed protein product [Hermetia illucens]